MVHKVSQLHRGWEMLKLPILPSERSSPIPHPSSLVIVSAEPWTFHHTYMTSPSPLHFYPPLLDCELKDTEPQALAYHLHVPAYNKGSGLKWGFNVLVHVDEQMREWANKEGNSAPSAQIFLFQTHGLNPNVRKFMISSCFSERTLKKLTEETGKGTWL